MLRKFVDEVDPNCNELFKTTHKDIDVTDQSSKDVTLSYAKLCETKDWDLKDQMNNTRVADL